MILGRFSGCCVANGLQGDRKQEHRFQGFCSGPGKRDAQRLGVGSGEGESFRY